VQVQGTLLRHWCADHLPGQPTLGINCAGGMSLYSEEAHTVWYFSQSGSSNSFTSRDSQSEPGHLGSLLAKAKNTNPVLDGLVGDNGESVRKGTEYPHNHAGDPFPL